MKDIDDDDARAREDDERPGAALAAQEDADSSSADADPPWLEEIMSLFFSLTGRLWDYARDGPHLKRARSIATHEQILEAVRRAAGRHRPRFEGDRIRSFAYFVPAIEELAASDKARQEVAAGAGKRPDPHNQANSKQPSGKYADLIVDGSAQVPAG